MPQPTGMVGAPQQARVGLAFRERLAPRLRTDTWRIWWVILSLGAALPLMLTPFPPLYDYYHWLFDGYVLAALVFGGPGSAAVQAHYALLTAPVPNLAAPLSIALLSRRFDLEVAGEIFLVACVLGFAYAFAILVRTIQQRPTVLEFFGLPWAFGYFLSKGYLSYLVSLALVFVALALLHGSTAGATRRPGVCTLITLAGLGVGLYLAHLLGWAVFALTVGVYTLALLRRGQGWRALWLPVTLVPSLGLLAWYLLSPHPPTVFLFYPSAVEKGLSLVEPLLLFLRADPFPALVPVFWANVIGLGLLAAVWWWQVKRPAMARGAGLLLGVSALLLVGALLIPFSQVSDLIRPDERLLLPAALLALAAIRFPAFTMRGAVGIVGVILLLLGLHFVEYQRVSQAWQQIDTATTAALPAGAPVVSFTVYEWEVRGSCAAEPFVSVGAPTLKWFGLDRVEDTGGGLANLMDTSAIALRFDPAQGAALFAEEMTPEQVRAAAGTLGAQYALHYPYAEVFGCPADIQLARQALAPQYQLVTLGTYYAVLRRE